MLMIQAVALKMGTLLVVPVTDVRVNYCITFYHDEPMALRQAPAAQAKKHRYKNGQPSPLLLGSRT